MVKRPILIDTNIVSTYAKIGDLEFLFRFSRRNILHISANVYNEIEEASHIGFRFVEPVITLINGGRLLVLSMSDLELKWCMGLPPSFGKGERDSLAICKFRNGLFLTNEKKIINFCDKESIPALNLPSILRHSWKKGLHTKDEVKAMIRYIEDKDNIKFKDITSIFED